MHTYIIKTPLSTLYHCDMLNPSKGHPQGVRLIHFSSKVKKRRVTHYTLLTVFKFTFFLISQNIAICPKTFSNSI